MIKTEFPYSHRGQDFVVSARCHSVDSSGADGLKIKFVDPETLDFVEVQLNEFEQEDLEEICIEALNEKQSEMEFESA